MPQQVYPEDYSCIVDPVNGCGGMYIGNLQAAQNLPNLKRLGIKAVLTASKGIELGHSKTDIPYFLYVPGQDHQRFDLSKYFHQGANFIHDCLQRTNIMIHCLAGVSRSVTLALAYFIKHKGYPLNRAFDLIKSRRRIIHPNQGFIEHLKRFEKEMSHHQEAHSSSPSKRSLQSLSYSPRKKYVPNKEVEAIISKYQNYKNQAFNSTRKNPEQYSQLKKQDSGSTQTTLSPEQSRFRGKRVVSMNVDRHEFYESKNELYESRNDLGGMSRRRIGGQFNPLDNINNRQSHFGPGVADIDKKIEQIRRKYQEYQSPAPKTSYSRYSAQVDENVGRGLTPSNNYNRDYLRYVNERRQMVGSIGPNRVHRPTYMQY